jgi:hypothetical protein
MSTHGMSDVSEKEGKRGCGVFKAPAIVYSRIRNLLRTKCLLLRLLRNVTSSFISSYGAKITGLTGGFGEI